MFVHDAEKFRDMVIGWLMSLTPACRVRSPATTVIVPEKSIGRQQTILYLSFLNIPVNDGSQFMDTTNLLQIRRALDRDYNKHAYETLWRTLSPWSGSLRVPSTKSRSTRRAKAYLSECTSTPLLPQRYKNAHRITMIPEPHPISTKEQRSSTPRSSFPKITLTNMGNIRTYEFDMHIHVICDTYHYIRR